MENSNKALYSTCVTVLSYFAPGYFLTLRDGMFTYCHIKYLLYKFTTLKAEMSECSMPVCDCPLLSSRKYYKRLKQSFTQFWAVMMITRNTIKRRHWRKVDMTERLQSPWLGFLATVCLLRLLCNKSLLQVLSSVTAYEF